MNYWDTASTLAGEVDEVKTTYPKALAVAMVAVVLSYFLPLSGDPDRFSYPLVIQLSYGQWLYPFRGDDDDDDDDDDDLRLNMVIFQSYVKLPEGIGYALSEGRTGSFDRRLAVLSNTIRGHSTDG